LAKILGRSSAASVPDDSDLPGLAWLLGASYSEMEEVFKGVASHFGEPIPNSPTWHRDLLDQMAAPGNARGSVVFRPL
jgi:hypothetical protein